MARSGVSYLDVANAAQYLVAAGRTPTIESIRIKLGTGSNTTLGTYLKTWKSKQDQTQQIATKENIPEELISALKGVWERVMNHSEEIIQTIRQETQQRLAQLKQEVQRFEKDNAHQLQQNQLLKQERDGLVHEKLVIEQLFNEVKIEISSSTEKCASLEKQNQDKQELIDELRRQNQQIQANLEHYRNASLEQRITDEKRYERQLQQLEQTIQQASQELQKTKDTALEFQQEKQQVKLENNMLRNQLETLNKKHESTNANLTDTCNELTRITQDQQHWDKQFKTLQTKHDEQNKLYLDLQNQYAVLLQQSETTKIALKELRDQNKLLAHEKWELGQEKAQLYGQLKQLECFK